MRLVSPPMKRGLLVLIKLVANVRKKETELTVGVSVFLHKKTNLSQDHEKMAPPLLLP